MAAQALMAALDLEHLYLGDGPTPNLRRFDLPASEVARARPSGALPVPSLEAEATPWAVIGLAGGALVLTGVGLGFGLDAQHLSDQAGIAAFADDGARLHQDAQASALVANVVLGAAAVTAASALVWWIID